MNTFETSFNQCTSLFKNMGDLLARNLKPTKDGPSIYHWQRTSLENIGDTIGDIVSHFEEKSTQVEISDESSNNDLCDIILPGTLESEADHGRKLLFLWVAVKMRLSELEKAAPTSTFRGSHQVSELIDEESWGAMQMRLKTLNRLTEEITLLINVISPNRSPKNETPPDKVVESCLTTIDDLIQNVLMGGDPSSFGKVRLKFEIFHPGLI